MKTRDLILIIMGSLFGVMIAGLIIYRYKKEIANIAGNGYEYLLHKTGRRKWMPAPHDSTIPIIKRDTEVRGNKVTVEQMNEVLEGLRKEILGDHKEHIGKLDQFHKEHMMQLDELINKVREMNERNAEMFPDLPRTDEERAQRAKEHEEEIEIIRKETEQTRATGIIFKTGRELSQANREHSDVVAHFTNISNIGKYTPEQISANFENANAKVAEAEKKCEEAKQNHYRISLELELLRALQIERKNKLKDGVQSINVVLVDDGGSQKQSELNGGVSK